MIFPFEIVIVSSDLERRKQLAEILAKQGLDPPGVASLKQCQDVFNGHSVGLVFCDPVLPDGTYRDLLAAYRLAAHKPRVVLISPDADWDDFRAAIRAGAFDVISWPCRPTDVEWMLIRAGREEQIQSDRHLAAFRDRPEQQRPASTPGI
jgi:DNA-binding NtrC family response regulator